MEFSASFTIGEKEVARFTRRMQWDQKQLMHLVLTGLGMVAGNFVLRFFVPVPSFWAQVLCSLLGGAVAFGIVYGSFFYSVVKSCNGEFVSGRRWSYTQTLTITPLGVTCTTQEGEESHLDFDELLVEECPEAFYIFTSKTSAWIVPKVQLKDPQADAAKIRKIFITMAEPQRLNLRRARG